MDMNQKIQAVMPELLAATQVTLPQNKAELDAGIFKTMSKAEWIANRKIYESPNASDAYMEYRWLTFLHSTLYPNCSTRFVNQLDNVVYDMLVEETA